MLRTALVDRFLAGDRQPEPQADYAGRSVSSRFFRWSPLLSRVLAALLLIPALPVTLVCMLLVRLTSRGPAIYRQVRVGRHGRHFSMYKLRTMRVDAEKHGAVWAKVHDHRVTLFGRFLRKTHLDELPQLFNVLKGDMALVGPRPERPEFVHRLAREIPGYLRRLAVLPGVTGLAQLNLPPDSDLDSVRRKLILDLEFIQHNSLSLELRLLFCTGLRIFKLPVLGLFRLHRHVSLPDDSRADKRLETPIPRERDLPGRTGPHAQPHKSNGSSGHSHRPMRAK